MIYDIRLSWRSDSGMSFSIFSVYFFSTEKGVVEYKVRFCKKNLMLANFIVIKLWKKNEIYIDDLIIIYSK